MYTYIIRTCWPLTVSKETSYSVKRDLLQYIIRTSCDPDAYTHTRTHTLLRTPCAHTHTRTHTLLRTPYAHTHTRTHAHTPYWEPGPPFYPTPWCSPTICLPSPSPDARLMSHKKNSQKKIPTTCPPSPSPDARLMSQKKNDDEVTSSYIVSHHHTGCHRDDEVTSSYIVSHHHT